MTAAHKNPDIEYLLTHNLEATYGSSVFLGWEDVYLGGYRFLTFGRPADFDNSGLGENLTDIGVTIWEIDPDDYSLTVLDSELLWAQPGNFYTLGSSSARMWVDTTNSRIGFYIASPTNVSTGSPVTFTNALGSHGVFGRFSWDANGVITVDNVTTMSTTGASAGNGNYSQQHMMVALDADFATGTMVRIYTTSNLNGRKFYQVNNFNLATGAYGGSWPAGANCREWVGDFSNPIGTSTFFVRTQVDKVDGTTNGTEFMLTLSGGSISPSTTSTIGVGQHALVGRWTIHNDREERVGVVSTGVGPPPTWSPYAVSARSTEYLSGTVVDNDGPYFEPWAEYNPSTTIHFRPSSTVADSIGPAIYQSAPNRYRATILEFDYADEFRPVRYTPVWYDNASSITPPTSRASEDNSIRVAPRYRTATGYDLLVFGIPESGTALAVWVGTDYITNTTPFVQDSWDVVGVVEVPLDQTPHGGASAVTVTGYRRMHYDANALGELDWVAGPAAVIDEANSLIGYTSWKPGSPDEALLEIWDVSNPSSWSLQGYLHFDDDHTFGSSTGDESGPRSKVYKYPDGTIIWFMLVGGGTDSGLWLFDVTDPSNIFVASKIRTSYQDTAFPGFTFQRIPDQFVCNEQYLYVSDVGRRLIKFDISVPTNPIQLTSLVLDSGSGYSTPNDVTGGSIFWPEVMNDQYVACSVGSGGNTQRTAADGIYVYDVSGDTPVIASSVTAATIGRLAGVGPILMAGEYQVVGATGKFDDPSPDPGIASDVIGATGSGMFSVTFYDLDPNVATSPASESFRTIDPTGYGYLSWTIARPVALTSSGPNLPLVVFLVAGHDPNYFSDISSNVSATAGASPAICEVVEPYPDNGPGQTALGPLTGSSPLSWWHPFDFHYGFRLIRFEEPPLVFSNIGWLVGAAGLGATWS